MSVTITSYPNGDLNQVITTADTILSDEIVKYVYVAGADFANEDYFTIEYNGETVTVTIVDECRYTPKEIHFVNKDGAQQVLTFYKASEEDMRVKSDDYESDRGQPLLGNHQYIKYNISGKTRLKVNSGYVDEDRNETFKQLMLSERVWLYENSIFVPLNVNSSSIKYKTRQKDRLISYEIRFDYAYNDVNNI